MKFYLRLYTKCLSALFGLSALLVYCPVYSKSCSAYASQIGGHNAFARIVTMSNSDCTTFTRIITSVARQGAVTIIVEGTPTHPEIASEIANRLIGRISLKDVLDTVANSCDYSTEYVDDICLMRKRYLDPADLPTASYAETALAFHNGARLLAQFAPKKTFAADGARPFVLEFVNTLDAEQIKNARTGIRVTQLTTEQKNITQQLVFNIFLGQIKTLLDVDYILSHAPDISLAMQKTIVGNGPTSKRAFGYELLDASGKAAFYPLGLKDLHTLENSEGDTGRTNNSRETEFKSDSSINLTLKEAIAAFPTSGEDQFSLDTELAAKPILIAGTQHSPAAEQLQAIAAAFDLRIRSYPDGRKSIVTPTVRTPVNISYLFSEIRALMPTSLLKVQNVRRCRDTAVEELERLTLPRMSKEGDKKSLAMSEMTEEEKRLLAIAIALETANGLKDTPPIPKWVMDIDQIDSISARTTVDPQGGRHMVVGIHILQGDRRQRHEVMAASILLRDLPSPLPEEHPDPPHHRTLATPE